MNFKGDFSSLVTQARLKCEEGKFHESLKLCQDAYTLNPSPSLMRKIVRLQNLLNENTKENIPIAPKLSDIHLKEADRHLVNESKKCMSSGNITESVNLLKETYVCAPSDEIEPKIERIKETYSTIYPSPASNIKESSKEEKLNKDTQSTLVDKAKVLYQSGDYIECLRLLKKAYKLEQCDKIRRKIERIENYLKENGILRDHYGHMPHTENVVATVDNDSEKNLAELISELVEVADGFSVPKLLYNKLYDYQKYGVKWLWNLHQKNSGGILADDMGLGKTVQVIAFLSGLFVSSKSVCAVLVVMPVSVLVTWEAELKRWAPALRVMIFHDNSRSDRIKCLISVQRHGGIVLTTYGTLVSSIKDLSTDLNANPEFLRSYKKQKSTDDDADDILARTGKEFHWTYLILDEGHKVKNPSAKTTKAAQTIYADHCILLTGTAVQNNLKELWSLYNVTHRGRLLGTQKTFSIEYDKPITRGREKDATRAEKVHGQLMAESLRRIIDPYFLRRTKSEVLSQKHNMNAVVPMKDKIPRKTEIVLWVYLSSIQESTYRDFLQLDHVKELLMMPTKRSPLMELIILKKLCDHPRLLSTEQCLNLNLNYDDNNNDNFPINGAISHKIHFPSAERLIKESGKFLFLHCLMKQFLLELQSNPRRDSPRTLVFSQSLKFLDMAEKVILDIKCPLNNSLSNNDNTDYPTQHRILRLDGRTSKVCDRLNIINKFQNDKSYTVMLLTTQVGGVGLTITAANRVIILDPSWNPAVDSQAVDRAYRIGQKLDVVVYRLITCATVEEKIYRRQIFKDSVIRQTTSTGQNKTDLDPYRYFSRQELVELFSLGDPRISETKRQLDMLHDGSDRWSDNSISPHLEFLCSDALKHIIYGLSFHDLMFSKESINDEAIDTDHEKLYVLGRCVAAERAIAEECATEGRVLDKEVSSATIQTESNVNSLPTHLANLNLQHKFPSYTSHNHDSRYTNHVPLNQLFKPSVSDTCRPMFNRLITSVVNPHTNVIGTSSNTENIDHISNIPVEHNTCERQLIGQNSPVAVCGVHGPHSPNSEGQLQDATGVTDMLQKSMDEYLESKKSCTNQLHFEYIDQPSGKNVVNPNPVVDHITIEDSIAQSLQEMSITQKSSLGSHDDEKINRESNILKTPLNNLRSSLNPRKSNSNFYRSTPLSSRKPTNISPHEHFEQYEQEFIENASDVKSPTTNYCPIQDFIHMDISVDVNEDDIANTVDMNSIQQVLAKSGFLNTTTSTNEARKIEIKDTMAKSVKTCEIRKQHELDLISKKSNSTKLTSDFEVVMDSYISRQSMDDETHIDDSDVIEASF
ncbi:DNA excision repair protein ERCC-6-like [Schistosoma japonicum]|nr:DNA excision repair protein ERCC-6-like [Schistosoma japonicum]